MPAPTRFNINQVLSTPGAPGAQGAPGAAGSAANLINDVTVSGNAATVNAVKNVPISVTALAKQQGLVYDGASFSPSSVETVFHVDTYIAKNGGNVTVGINACLTAAASISQTQGVCPVVVFGASVYNTTAPLVLFNAFCVRIRGAGMNSSYINPTGAGVRGQTAFQMVNCAYCTVEDVMVGPAPVTTLLTAGASAGATSIVVTSVANIVNGQKIGIQNAAQTLAEVVTVTGAPSGLTVPVTALRNTYAIADGVLCGTLNGYQSFIDHSQTLNLCTHNRFIRCGYGAVIQGISFACNGGTGGASDTNNDIHIIEDCQAIGTPITNVAIEHSQSLGIEILNGSFAGTYGVSCLTGGSFSVLGGVWGVTGVMLALGGTIGRTCSIVGLLNTDAGAMLVQARPSDACVLNPFYFGGCSGGSRGPGVLPSARVIDITGSTPTFVFNGCSIGAGAGPSDLVIYCKDSAGSSTGKMTFTDCNLWAYGGTADSTHITSINTTWVSNNDGLIHETTLNGGHFSHLTAGSVTTYATGPRAQGEMVGYSVTENQTAVSAATYTLDSGGIKDHTILCSNVSTAQTYTLPVQSRPGRVFKFVALSAAHTITLTPQGGSLINGAAPFVFSPTAVGQTVTIEGDGGTNWYTDGAPFAAVMGTADQLYGENHAGTAASFFTLTGDGSIASGALTVGKVNGTTYPAGGALVTGNSPHVSAVGAVTYQALNLAGGSGWVTGSLPAGNQANQSMVGDVTGNTGASVVSTISGTAPVNVVNSALSFGATPATSGAIRMPSGFTLQARNNANTANFSLLSINASDQLVLGTAQAGFVTTAFNVATGGSFRFLANNQDVLDVSDGLLSLADPGVAYAISQPALASTSIASGSNGLTTTLQGQPGQAATGATHNGGNGGTLVLAGGPLGTSGSATPGQIGNVEIDFGANGQALFKSNAFLQAAIGYTSASSGFGALYLGNGNAGFTPNNSNYTILSDGTNSYFQAPVGNGLLHLRGGNATDYWTMTTGTLTAADSLQAYTVSQPAQASTSSASGAVGHTFALVGQPGQPATGAGNNGGNGAPVSITGGAPGTSGSASAGSGGPVVLSGGGANPATLTAGGEVSGVGGILAGVAGGGGDGSPGSVTMAIAGAQTGLSITTLGTTIDGNSSGFVTLRNGGAASSFSVTQNGLVYGQTTIALTTGTVVISATQHASPLHLYTGTLTGNITLDFNGITGGYQLDFSGVTIGGFTISVKNGTTTTVVTSLITTFKTLLIASMSSTNKLSIG